MTTPEVTSVGEVLIDLVSDTPTKDLASAERFVKLAGGAPANVAVGLARLGIRTAFLGKVGDDPFGRFLRGELTAHGVLTDWLVDDRTHKTRLAFVAVTKQGGRDFEFWEQDPADQHLLTSDIALDAVCASSIINIGPFLLLHPRTRKTAFALARHANKRGKLVCFDPNIRLSLWEDATEAMEICRSMIRTAAILRLNLEEARLVSGAQTVREASSALLAMGPRLVVITDDKRGCSFATRTVSGSVKGFRVKAVDTTGCGDGFLAGLLSEIIRNDKAVDALSKEELIGICRTANAVGALVAGKRGAIAAMPGSRQLDAFLRLHA